MNMAVTLAVYASICKHTGRPFVYPGSPEQYNAVTDVTDARILAKQLLLGGHDASGGRTCRSTSSNGDVFRWTWLWQQIADYFGIEAAPYPGQPTPLGNPDGRCAKRSGPRSSPSTGLQDIPVNRLASWWHSDADLGRTLECFTDMTNSRTLGFDAYQSTRSSFIDVFDELRARRIIPA